MRHIFYQSLIEVSIQILFLVLLDFQKKNQQPKQNHIKEKTEHRTTYFVTPF